MCLLTIDNHAADYDKAMISQAVRLEHYQAT